MFGVDECVRVYSLRRGFSGMIIVMDIFFRDLLSISPFASLASPAITTMAYAPLQRVMLLLDARHGFKKLDIEFLELLYDPKGPSPLGERGRRRLHDTGRCAFFCVL